MRILWVMTTPMGPASRILNIKQLGSSGGWIQNEYVRLMEGNSNDTEMYFLCGSRQVKKGTIVSACSEEGKAYCVNLPRISLGIELPKVIEANIVQILSAVNPDIIHIWGTESCISYGVTKASPGIKKILYLQGLIGIHGRYRGGYLSKSKENNKYREGMPTKTLFRQKIRDIYFEKQIPKEQYIIRNVQGVILDNEFSEAYCRMVSDGIRCYYRYLLPGPDFLDSCWEYASCNKNTIFTIYGQSPDKGLHQLLKALCIVNKQFPDVKLIVPGPFHCRDGKLIEKSKLSAHEIWLSNFIKQNGLDENVLFVGKLSAAEMSENIKNCNVFVNPSCMEIHALSLREALTVGAPCISSLCGSVLELVEHSKNGLIYRYEEYEILAYWICKVLEDENYARNLSQYAREKMRGYFKAEDLKMLDIYKDVLEID